MARPRTVDRDHLLTAAEKILSASGTAALSFGNVAIAAGLPKATVQSVFGTREGLIEAILERWLQQEQVRFQQIAGPAPSPHERIRAHIKSTAGETAELNSRLPALLAALAGFSYQASSVANWYKSRIGDFSAVSPEERRQRIAFLAAEGAFYIRYLAGIPMNDELWHEIFEDLAAFEESGLPRSTDTP